MNPYEVTPPPQASGNTLPLHPSGRELFVWASRHQNKSPEQIQKLLQPLITNSSVFQQDTDYYSDMETEYYELTQKYETLMAKYDGVVAHHGIVRGG